MFLTCPFCHASLPPATINPNALVTLCHSCTRVIRLTPSMKRLLRHELTASELAIAYPDDYDIASFSSPSSEAEEAYLTDANPYRVDPYLAVSVDEKYRAELTVDSGCLVIHTKALGRIPFWRFSRLALGLSLPIAIGLTLVFFLSPHLFFHQQFSLAFFFPMAIWPIGLIMIMTRRYHWAFSGRWEMTLSDRFLTYERSDGTRKLNRSIPLSTLKIVPLHRSPTTNEEWFGVVAIQISGSKQGVVYFPCASSEERDWLLREIEKYTRFTQMMIRDIASP